MSDQPFPKQDSSQSTRDVAVEESKSVGQDAKEGAKQVAQTAGEEAQAVAGEAKAQVTSLYENLRQDVSGQARDQTQRAATGLQGLAGELSQMADGTESGMAGGVVRQVAERVDAAAGWLEGREPADLLDEVRRYARRKPGTFLAACAVVGFVGGRLTRGLRDESQDQQDARTGGYAGAGYTDQQALMPRASTAPAPQPLMTDAGYGGRPSAPEGTGGLGMATGAGYGAAGTAAGNPIPTGPGRTEAELDGSGPFADAPDLGQGALDGSTQEEGGDRR